MKKIKIEIPFITVNDKKSSVILYAETDGDIETSETVKTICNPIISVVDTPETAAGEET